MLDKNTENVLKTIKESCDDGRYKVFSADDFDVGEYNVVSDIIDFLTERKFIELRYKDDDSFCLTVLSKGRLYEEEKQEKFGEKKKYSSFVKFAFWGSLAGAFLGGFTAVLLVELVRLLIS